VAERVAGGGGREEEEEGLPSYVAVCGAPGAIARATFRCARYTRAAIYIYMYVCMCVYIYIYIYRPLII